MRLFLGAALLLFATVAMPVGVSAQTISVSQTITITARVEPARSIVVDNDGTLIKILSNTDEAIEPKVYLDSVPGMQLTLTPALLAQYNAIISTKNDLVGVEIIVPQEPIQQPQQNVSFYSKVVRSMSILHSKM